jgi:Mg2+-importing ATPase
VVLGIDGHPGLVVFAIRTRRLFFRSPPSRVGKWFGFVAPPPLFYAFLISVLVAYLTLIEVTKAIFYRASVRAGAQG